MMKKFLTGTALTLLLTATLAAQQKVEYSVVPAMSSLKRLADTEPVDGKKSGTLALIAAKGEIESASFVLRSDKDVKDVSLKVSDLKTADGKTIPASAIDLKIVKIWYQSGTGWHSYFSDNAGRTLVPELLLNDETLIRTDDKLKGNYLRVTTPAGETRYIYISHPHGVDIPVSIWKFKVADSDTLQPFSLDAKAWKQIWVTADAPVDAEGLYRGKIDVVINKKAVQTIPVAMRVLPFELPAPKTYYDLNKDFYAGAYSRSNLFSFMGANGKDLAAAEKRLQAVYRNYKRHNLLHPGMPPMRFSKDTDPQDLLYRRQLEIYKEAGLGTKALFNAISALPSYEYLVHKDRKLPLSEQTVPENWAKNAVAGKKIIEEILGKDVAVYCFGWDEPWMQALRAQRKCWEFLHDLGLKTYTTGHKNHLYNNGYNEDFINYGGEFSPLDPIIVHAMGGKIGNYAEPHTGIENPDMARRIHGLNLYLQNFDATMNYGADGDGDCWNDFGMDHNFRTFGWTFPGTVDPINTLPFEGYREAIDDIRYATLLKQLADKAINSGKTQNVYAGKRALQYLALLDSQKADYNTARLEMIRHILNLRNIVK